MGALRPQSGALSPGAKGRGSGRGETPTAGIRLRPVSAIRSVGPARSRSPVRPSCRSARRRSSAALPGSGAHCARKSWGHLRRTRGPWIGARGNANCRDTAEPSFRDPFDWSRRLDEPGGAELPLGQGGAAAPPYRTHGRSALAKLGASSAGREGRGSGRGETPTAGIRLRPVSAIRSIGPARSMSPVGPSCRSARRRSSAALPGSGAHCARKSWGHLRRTRGPWIRARVNADCRDTAEARLDDRSDGFNPRPARSESPAGAR